ncbi:MAG: hypothetical protein PVI35_02885, partial [Acidimicrobiia bacterium]
YSPRELPPTPKILNQIPIGVCDDDPLGVRGDDHQWDPAAFHAILWIGTASDRERFTEVGVQPSHAFE